MDIADGLRTMQHDDGAAVLDIRRGVISTFNETGAYIWNALQHGESVETIVAKLAYETGVAANVVEADVKTFLEDLETHNLLSA
jgi:predicted regulator of amino acid metabolism with ACT domain